MLDNYPIARARAALIAHHGPVFRAIPYADLIDIVADDVDEWARAEGLHIEAGMVATVDGFVWCEDAFTEATYDAAAATLANLDI